MTTHPAAAPPIRVLIVCTGNSARSILAEAVLRSVGGERFEVHSAGTHPKGLNPLTLRVLEEARLPTGDLRSKSVEEFRGQSFDYVITVCDQARESCPVFPGTGERLHWGYDDPAAVEGDEETRLRAFRRVFAQIGERIRTFVVLVERARRDAASGAAPDAANDATVALLRRVPLFSAMTEKALGAVARIAGDATFAAGELLTREGEPGDTFLVLVEGSARVERGGETVATLGAGDFLGEIAVLDGGVRSATVTATSPVRALVIHRLDLVRLVDDSPAVRLAVLEALTQHLRRDARALA